MEKILNTIKKYDNIVIFGHQRPDGDCIGSQYGLYHIIKDTYPNKNVYISGEVSQYVSFIGAPEFISLDIIKNSLAICVDCATKERLSDQNYKFAKEIIKIDHHLIVDQYGDYNYVDEASPACAEIITEFYQKFSSELIMSKKAAEALYVGILTDTGRFKFDSITPKTFHMAALLLDKGIDLSYIDNNLSVETLNTLKLKGYCLLNFSVTENGFAYIKMTREIINKYGVSDEDAAAQVSTISTIEGSPVWAMFIEYPTEIRIRLRSRGPEIATLASKFGGGGHPKAAGAHLDSWNQLDKFVKEADLVVKEYKNN